MVDLSVMMWLPTMLQQSLNYNALVSGEIAAMYEYGSTAGSVTSGFLVGVVGFRSPVFVPWMLIAIPFLLLTSYVESVFWLNFIVFFTGVWIGGGENLLAAVPSEIGE